MEAIRVQVRAAVLALELEGVVHERELRHAIRVPRIVAIERREEPRVRPARMQMRHHVHDARLAEAFGRVEQARQQAMREVRRAEVVRAEVDLEAVVGHPRRGPLRHQVEVDAGVVHEAVEAIAMHMTEPIDESRHRIHGGEVERMTVHAGRLGESVRDRGDGVVRSRARRDDHLRAPGRERLGGRFTERARARARHDERLVAEVPGRGPLHASPTTDHATPLLTSQPMNAGNQRFRRTIIRL
jgi:hypothetical protein